MGSLKSESQVSLEDREEISQIAGVPIEDIHENCAKSRRYFSSEIGFSGTVLISNEFVLVVPEEGERFVFRIHSFISVLINDRSHVFVKGEAFKFIRDFQGVIERNVWTGFGRVPVVSDESPLLIKARDISRKVILFKGRNPNTLIVTDFQRREKELHYTVNVPPWVELNDMVLIQGQAIDEIWHGKFMKIDPRNDEITVVFFKESLQDVTLFVRESLVRRSRSKVSMKSVIGVGCGRWLTKTTWKKS